MLGHFHPDSLVSHLNQFYFFTRSDPNLHSIVGGFDVIFHWVLHDKQDLNGKFQKGYHN